MMLMIVLCFIVPAHSFSRNQTPTTPAPTNVKTDGPVDECVRSCSRGCSERGIAPTDMNTKGPADADDRLDDLARLIYGNNVSMIQHVFSQIILSRIVAKQRPSNGKDRCNIRKVERESFTTKLRMPLCFWHGLSGAGQQQGKSWLKSGLGWEIQAEVAQEMNTLPSP
ncbi:hypothetical protein GCK32_016837 [Trichostrongylus colubriformis]|uniref:Uncharacterized protein n=1 Tax=Trichostrongylus colubriformis TaxID=6319 RepID=A0AAN8IS53_TRICO